MTTARFSLFTLAFALLLFPACGAGDDDDVAGGPDGGSSGGADARPNVGRYFPMDVGASWSYRVEQAGASIGTKQQTVEALEDIGGAKAGITAFRLRTLKPSGKVTVSWQEDTGDAIVRHREETFAADQSQETEELYAPDKVRVDEAADHVRQGAVFATTYREDVTDYTLGGAISSIDKTERWEVEAVDIPVTVPAGTFLCLQIHRTNSATGSDKRYWFARGVGKIREEGGGQTELLTAFTLP